MNQNSTSISAAKFANLSLWVSDIQKSRHFFSYVVGMAELDQNPYVTYGEKSVLVFAIVQAEEPLPYKDGWSRWPADTSVINDTLLRGGLQFLDGVILEKLQRFADARAAFEMVCNSVPTSPDSMLAGWRLKKLDLLELGADHGADYDLAMNAWNDQIRSDLKRYRTPLLPQAKRSAATGPPAGTNTCELTGIAPNPFSGKTTVGLRVFRAQNVRLEIADMQGRVLTVLTDREFGAGEHEIEFRNNGYAPGVYLCRMRTADGHVQTEQLFIR